MGRLGLCVVVWVDVYVFWFGMLCVCVCVCVCSLDDVCWFGKDVWVDWLVYVRGLNRALNLSLSLSLSLSLYMCRLSLLVLTNVCIY
jgi:hypothetical protein